MSEAETIDRMLRLVREEFDKYHKYLAETGKWNWKGHRGDRDGPKVDHALRPVPKEPFMEMTWPDMSDEGEARIRYAEPCGQTLAFTAIAMGLSADQAKLTGSKREDKLIVDLRRAA